MPPSLSLLRYLRRMNATFSTHSNCRRQMQRDARIRYSNFWIPPIAVPKTSAKNPGQDIDANHLLVKAGFLQQPYPGIFHLLPLGLRIQDKLEKLIDKHMRSLGASKLSLSSLSSELLWDRSGRLATSSELFRFDDRRQTGWLLSPTHEEEITSLVSQCARSYRDLPLRLYQISRKYRDELRPRHGLLRAREFLMKDLYTFDTNPDQALKTYEEVRTAYTNFFNELSMPYLVAKADSGNMGGSLSHEFHLPSAKGEDNILKCSCCQYTRNEELVVPIKYKTTSLDLTNRQNDAKDLSKLEDTVEYLAVSRDGSTLVKAYAPARRTGASSEAAEINPYAIKAAMPEVDLGVEDIRAEYTLMESALKQSTEQSGLPVVAYLFDFRLASSTKDWILGDDGDACVQNAAEVFLVDGATDSHHIDLLRTLPGDECPECDQGQLQRHRAIEVGHTFHLGTRYSEALGAEVTLANNEQAPMQMGCHGIGVSRLISAVALSLADERGLNWPRVMAPFQVVIITPHKKTDHEDVAALYDRLTSPVRLAESNADGPVSPLAIDAVIDDREDKSLVWKLHDADLIGFPVLVIFGRKWEQEGKLEVQCRRKRVLDDKKSRTPRGLCQDVRVEDVPAFVRACLEEL